MTLEELKIRKLQFPREAYARQLKNTWRGVGRTEYLDNVMFCQIFTSNFWSIFCSSPNPHCLCTKRSNLFWPKKSPGCREQKILLKSKCLAKYPYTFFCFRGCHTKCHFQWADDENLSVTHIFIKQIFRAAENVHRVPPKLISSEFRSEFRSKLISSLDDIIGGNFRK
jgi:hypothetical protein